MREVMGSSPFTSTKKRGKAWLFLAFYFAFRATGRGRNGFADACFHRDIKDGIFPRRFILLLPVDFFGEMEATILFIVLKIVFLAFPLTDSEADEFW